MQCTQSGMKLKQQIICCKWMQIILHWSWWILWLCLSSDDAQHKSLIFTIHFSFYITGITSTNATTRWYCIKLTKCHVRINFHLFLNDFQNFFFEYAKNKTQIQMSNADTQQIEIKISRESSDDFYNFVTCRSIFNCWVVNDAKQHRYNSIKNY